LEQIQQKQGKEKLQFAREVGRSEDEDLESIHDDAREKEEEAKGEDDGKREKTHGPFLLPLLLLRLLLRQLFLLPLRLLLLLLLILVLSEESEQSSVHEREGTSGEEGRRCRSPGILVPDNTECDDLRSLF
jgi:hypothetical protein